MQNYKVFLVFLSVLEGSVSRKYFANDRLYTFDSGKSTFDAGRSTSDPGKSTFGENVLPEVRTNPPRTCTEEFEIQNMGETVIFKSPGYPKTYPDNLRCFYFIKGPANSLIHLFCPVFNVELSTVLESCAYDQFRYFLDGNMENSRLSKYSCGSGIIDQVSYKNELKAVFLTDGTNPRSDPPYRFNCTATTIRNPFYIEPVTPSTTTPEPVTSKPIEQCSCGQPKLQKERRIVGGEDAGKGQFPWRCVLHIPELGNYCGCAVISRNWVMTAAHCALAAQEAGMYLLQVDLGRYDISIKSKDKGVRVHVNKIIIHEEYDAQSQDNDIALMQLTETINFDNYIQPVCLPFKFIGISLNKRNATATGWGYTNFGGGQASKLQKAELEIVDTENCRRRFKGFQQKGLVTDNMLCTYGGTRDMCQGDSGGGIDIFDKESGRYFEVGISSWGIGCGDPEKPGAHVKLALRKFLDWIEKHVGNELCKVS